MRFLVLQSLNRSCRKSFEVLSLPSTTAQMSQRQQLGFIFMYCALQAHFVVSTAPKFLDTLPSFNFPEGNQLSNLVVDHRSGDVFVVGRNVLYHFSADLEMKQNVRTGPVNDAHDCSIPPNPCDKERVPTDNDNHILKIIYFLGPPSKLLLCGSVYKKLCQIRPMDNLSEVHWVYPHNDNLGYNLGRESNRALFERGYEGQWTLFTAHTEHSDDPSYFPVISKKVVVKENDGYHFQYPLQNDSASSYMFIDRTQKRLIRNEGFVYDGFVYFIAEHYWLGDSISANLFRFCIGDAKHQSYADMLIRCTYNGKFSDVQPKAHFGQSPTPGGKSLYMSYSTAPGTNLCMFPMSAIAKEFSKIPTEGQVGWLGSWCAMNNTIDNESVCGIRGYPLLCRNFDVNMSVFLPNVWLQTITTVKQRKEIVVIGGGNDNSVTKVRLSTGEIISKNYISDQNTTLDFPYSVFDFGREHIYFLFRSKIVKYPVASCGVHETCTLCLTRGQMDPLQCGWCAERCTRQDECPDSDLFSRDTCNPIIYGVLPEYRRIQVGTIIRILGDSFGDYVDEEHGSLSISDVPCEILFWNNSMATCKLLFAPEEKSGPVQLNTTSHYSSRTGHKYSVKGSAVSHQNFSYYLGPRIYGIHPHKGPTSGGTNVTFFGENLDYDRDKDRVFVVNERRCILSKLERNTASCKIANASFTEYPKESIVLYFNNMFLFIDKNPPSTFNITDLSQSFHYTRDPKVHQIQPSATTMSGLKNLTATGIYLNSVQFPKLVVKVSISQTSNNLEFSEECWSDPKFRGTIMTCRTPSLLETPGVPIPTWTDPLQTRVAFIMDGVQDLRDFNIYQDDLSRFLYYPDPVFEEVWIEGGEYLKIKGNHLNLINSEDNFKVMLGDDNVCKIKTISMEYITCSIPPNLMPNSTSFGTNISIEVLIGYSRHYLGKLIFEEPADVPEKLSPIWWIILVLILVCVILIAFICYKRWKQKSMALIDDVNPDLRDQHINDYIFMTSDAGDSSAVIVQSYTATAQVESAGNQITQMQLVDSALITLLEDKNLIIPKRRLNIGEKVGAGQFGCVFEGLLQHPDQTENVKVAIKTLHEHSWSNTQTVESFLKEALIMKDFNHPNVLSLLGVCFEGSGPSIVLPFMGNGDLCSYIRDETKVLLVTNLLKFAVDIASGMAYLGEKKFVHRDLAARNCILNSSLGVKVADFGLSRDVYQDDYYCCNDRNAKLPYRWMAPESLEKQKYSTKTDVWSYGVVLWEILTRGSVPYANVGNWDVLAYVKSGHRLDQPEYCPKSLYMVMLACWNQDSKKRPNFPLLYECIGHIRQRLLDSLEKKSPSKSVPAQHTVYYNAKDLYLRMDGHVLNKEILEQSCSVQNEYIDMNKQSSV